MKKNLSLTVTELPYSAELYDSSDTVGCRGTEYVMKYVGWTGRGKDGEFVLPPPGKRNAGCWRPLGSFRHRLAGSFVLGC